MNAYTNGGRISMFILHVELAVKADSSDALAIAYRESFCPAISKQPGFSEARLLLARSSQARTHRLTIAFESETLQRQWAATVSHHEAWAKMEPSITWSSGDFFDTV
jgi:heme-degrading monooxygenase HmoA